MVEMRITQTERGWGIDIYGAESDEEALKAYDAIKVMLGISARVSVVQMDNHHRVMSPEQVTRVVFVHDNERQKWEAHVEHAADTRGARQAFTAVVLTCQALRPILLGSTKVEVDGYAHRITPCV